MGLVFTYTLVVNAWLVDDAYITFRTIENALDGYGLRWNVDERVQSYTHPLWMFCLMGARVLTGEYFYSSLALSFLCNVGVLAVAYTWSVKTGEAAWKLPLMTLLFVSSKAVVDYSSSGLETPLVYLLATLFFLRFLSLAGDEQSAPRSAQVTELFFLAALSFFTRQDTLLIYVPALLFVLFRFARAEGAQRAAKTVAVATLPATLWVTFSLFYYGSAVPNTGLAKVKNAGIPALDRFYRGLEYLGNSLMWDTVSHLFVVLALILAYRSRSRVSLLALAGVLLYEGFVVVIAASATHMSGRFFAVPTLVAIITLVWLVRGRLLMGGVAAVGLVACALSPLAPWKADTDLYETQIQTGSAIDTRWFVYRHRMALALPKGKSRRVHHDWQTEGEKFRARPEHAYLGGSGAGLAIGYFGFGAGPDKFVVDYLGLTDPLIARLPGKNGASMDTWSSGHFERLIPKGYLESAAEDRNLIVDPDLRAYYGKLRSITRGPLLSAERLKHIVLMNLGAYNHWRDAYVKRDERDFRVVFAVSRGPHG
jgi:arabinofuranosyltransferase